MGLSNVRLKVW